MFAKFYIPCFLILFFCENIIAQKPIIITDSLKSINICSKSSFYVDKTNQLSFEKIEKKPFQNFQDDEYNFRFSPSTFWIKFTIDSKLQNNYVYIIQVTNWYIDVANLYSKNEKGEVKVLKAGDFEVFSKKTIKSKYPTFSLDIKANSTQTYFLKIENSQYNNFKINLVENLHYLQYKEFGDSRELILGLILMRFAFHISLLFYMFYDKNFRAYSYWGILLCFVYYFSGGYGGFVFPNSPYLANLAFFFAFSFVPALLSLFIYQIFDISNRLPQFKWIFIAFATVGILNLVINLFFHHAYLSWAYIAFMAFFILFQLVFSTWVYFKVYKPSFWYISPLILYLPMFSIYYIRNAGILNFNTDFNFIQFTFFLDFLSIPFITGALLKISKLENLKLEDSYFKEKNEAEKLQELNTLKTQFFTNISHEFRTPLTLLVGPIDDLQQKYPKEGMIVVMQRNLQRLQTLINQLLDISKLEAGEMTIHLQETDFSEFLNHLFASFESLAQSKKIIFNHSQSHLHQLGAFDLDKLEKIVTNLLSNAFKFTPENGRINVRVEYADKHIFLTVQDYGIGIAPERLPHIFDRFYQIDDSNQRQHEGTGIGLSLVKELVEVLNGKIDVSSELGKGTLFSLSLPFTNIEKPSMPLGQFVRKMALETAFVPTEEIKTINTENPILLIVEDNPDLRRYVGSIFENQYQLLMAVDGEEGLAKAIEFIPDMVVCDLMMPKLDGLGFCEQLKNDERINHIPVIMLTAKASLADKLIGLQHGADDYLSKPFNKEELTLRVKNLVGQRQLMREKYAFQTVEILPAIEVVKEPTMDELFIRKAKGIVDKHLDKSEFDVEAFANEMNLSSVQLRRKLKAITDQTVTEFVRNYRLEIASEMLKKKMGTVSEIAYKVGFESMPYFSKVFQEKYGKMASEWK
jgi:signal transduction histidine kinase/DNA-binding response OmpR family regulator